MFVLLICEVTLEEGFFEGVRALHTTVIRAADQREVGNLVRIRAPKSTDAANFAEMLRFPTLLLGARSRYKVFH